MAALIATSVRSAKKRTRSRRNRAVVLDLDLFRNLTTQLRERSDDCHFLFSFFVIITYTMAVYMGYMLHNTRKMVFHTWKKSKRRIKKILQQKGRPRGEDSGWMEGVRRKSHLSGY